MPLSLSRGAPLAAAIVALSGVAAWAVSPRQSQSSAPAAPLSGAADRSEEQPVVTGEPAARALDTAHVEKGGNGVNWFTQVAIPALAATASLSYVLARPGFDGFYGELGLRPEDVGYDQTRVLSLSAFIGFFFVTSLLIAASLGLIIYKVGRALRYIYRPPLALICMALWSGFYFRSRSLPYPTDEEEAFFALWRSHLSWALLLSAVALVLSPAEVWLTTKGRGVRDLFGARTLIALACAVLVSLSLVGGALIRDESATLASSLLRTPEAIRDNDPIFFWVLTTAMPVVSAVPLTGDRLGLCGAAEGWRDTGILLLGRADGGAYVIAYRSFDSPTARPDGRVFWLPSDDYAVVGTTGSTGCRQPGDFASSA